MQNLYNFGITYTLSSMVSDLGIGSPVERYIMLLQLKGLDLRGSQSESWLLCASAPESGDNILF
jgi:hypothetical protein